MRINFGVLNKFAKYLKIVLGRDLISKISPSTIFPETLVTKKSGHVWQFAATGMIGLNYQS